MSTSTAPGAILVAEDDAGILLVIETLLKSQGYEVVTSGDGKVAQDLLKAEANRLSAILLDWQMPKMTGIDLLRWIKTQPTLEHLPVIMVTGMVTKKHIKEGIDAGAFYYLTKPFDQQILLSIVHTAVSDYEYKQSLLRKLQVSENPFKYIIEGTFQFRSIDEGERLVVWVANACPSPRNVTPLSEIIINAVEHGNLGITYEEKSRLLANDTWSKEVQRRLQSPENSSKYVEMNIKKHPEKITVLVKDQGPGFDYDQYLRFDESRVFDNHGRGIAMAAAELDVQFQDKGNKVLVTIPL